MKHPFTGKGLLYYLSAWAIVSIAHLLVLHINYDIQLTVAVVDTLCQNALLAGFGFSLWWAIQYLTPSYQGTLGTIVTFAVVVILGASAINYVYNTIVLPFYQHNEAYQQFSLHARPWKLLTGSLYLCMVILVYYLMKHNYNLSLKAKEEAQLQEMLKHSELEMLKFQINPHFIFNSLNSINSLTISAPEQAQEMVIKLSDFLRGSLGQEKTEMHSLKEELDQMNLYLDIEKVRFGDRLTVNLEVEESVLSRQVPNMIMQPLYENAIKYGVYEQLDAVHINTNVKMEENYLVIRVSNNYDSNAMAVKGKGIGLNNVRSRLELIYGIPDLVTIERGRDKFCVKLEMPQEDLV